MACKASKTALLRAIAKRGFAVSACPRLLGEAADVKSSVLANKVVVATAEGSLPVARVSVVFRAGSRNETYEQQGVSHILRVATGLTTLNSTGFAITRNIQQIGGNLSCTVDRELVSYTVETTTDHIETGLRYLQDVIQPAFKPWELSELGARLRYHLVAVSPQVRAVELLHKAAFRQGLGYSVYIPKFQIGQLSSETLQHYVNNNFTTSRCAVVGVGIDHNTLSGFAQNLELSSGTGKSNASSYYGGDARKDKPGHLAHVAVAGQGAALTNPNEVLAFAVLQYALGNGAATKRGNVNGVFGKALAAAVGDATATVTTLNANYSDAGLLGYLVSADAQHVGKAVDALTRALKSGAVSNEDVNRGKALLRAHVLEAYGSDGLLINELAAQAALNRQVQSIDSLLSAIDTIQQKDVQDAARKAGSSKLSVGAVGNLANVPYSSELS